MKLAVKSGAIIPLLLILPNLAWLLFYSFDVGVNSGNTGEPHLHVHAQRPGPVGAPLGGDPLPLLFGGRFPVRGDRIVLP